MKSNTASFLITGHTGFKGTWMVYLLKQMGYKVFGYSDQFLKNSMFDITNCKKMLDGESYGDILDANGLKKSLKQFKPNVIVHFAAQSLVLESYSSALETFRVNTLGTAALLDSVKLSGLDCYVLVVTSDKVYKTNDRKQNFTELSEIGASDPYGTSKAAADLITQSWMESFGESKIAIARAGNVIGGGDTNSNRLVPDLVQALEEGQRINLRNPFAVRPWQHVLDCLTGYVALIENRKQWKSSEIWNFGPTTSERFTVEEFAYKFIEHWGENPTQILTKSIHQNSHFKETQFLAIDSSKAHKHLFWQNRMNFDESIQVTVEWFKNSKSQNPHAITLSQITRYLEKVE